MSARFAPDEMPVSMRALPLDHRGFPVPFFVAYVNGAPDFRVMDPDAITRCVRDSLCWICGAKLGQDKTFVCGPVSSLNRRSAEPPAHHSCAVFAAKVCPFLAMPKVKRREANLPTATQELPGVMLKHNPGITCLWTVRRYTIDHTPTGPLFDMGKPVRVSWYANAQPATRDEIMQALDVAAGRLADLAMPDEIPRIAFMLTRAKRVVMESPR